MAAARSGALLAAAAQGGRRMEKLGNPFRVIARDYLEVAKDAFKDAKDRPLKTLLYFLVGGGVFATWKTRPDASSYTDCLLSYSNDLFQCSHAVRNPQTHAYVDSTIKKLSNDQLAYKNFVFFAILMEREHNPVCKNYHVTCKHVQQRWWSRWSNNVVDVGVWGRWWALDRAMVGYDVNEEELADWLEQQKKF